jgi:prepilin-type N-terminal cleavage/methylation domain-containing protein
MRDSGFTLIETLITLVLVSIMIIGASYLCVLIKDQLQESTYYLEVDQLGNDIVEELVHRLHNSQDVNLIRNNRFDIIYGKNDTEMWQVRGGIVYIDNRNYFKRNYRKIKVETLNLQKAGNESLYTLTLILNCSGERKDYKATVDLKNQRLYGKNI